MADFVAVLRKTLDGLGETTPEMRERVYEKARATIASKLAAINPPPPPSVADRQKRTLEEAIRQIERDYAATSDPLAELENVFASLKNPQPKELPQPAVKSSVMPRATPAPPPPRTSNGVERQASAAPAAPGPRTTAAPTPAPAPQRRAPMAPPPEELDQDNFVPQRQDAVRRRSYGPLLVAALVLAVLAGGGYGVWLNRDAFSGLLGGDAPQNVAASTPDAAEPEPQAPAPETGAPATAEEGKFTQRLTPDGSETNPGPANGGAGVGEGTSVSALTQQPGEAPAGAPTSDQAAEAPAGADAGQPAASETAIPVGQKAIFYEERTGTSEGSAEPGSVVWSLVQESPGANLPPEAAIRAEAAIPGKNIQLRMTIKRNADKSLPASHIIEMIFLTPEGFSGGGIENILRVAMKGSEQEAGNPLIGIPAKIADGFFLVALNDTKAEIDANMTLLRRQSWIDVPIVYKSGRRALFTLEKGIPGDKVFDEALKAWTTASAG
ncbi:MAG: hypothetical protein KKB66_14440 [Alphaproteobacteria bacterium]|nr:hypothetical protein [Alphaproteobacteria bacterium]MBU0805608.1 hypothetical protein [Alphaproteobacteria bacterium]MBU0873554.1 hypothetical protein [Alphaproteobacteria bacterium]MBU1401218.1 hypothetical protein [Alphaproteobacteria bacterium]MBU1592365.1 hypothetical protein [Alphaproteobacteria bacterium]